MDIEFHYYITYLIAARAGYPPGEAAIIAHAAQSVDDNHIPVRVVDNEGRLYEDQISQTFDILHAHEDEQIYPVFHFIPGVPDAPSASRKDGVRHPMMTTPDSPLANRMLDAAIAFGDLYRIGASCHGFVDTWADQNFVGKRDAVNEFASSDLGKLEQKVLPIDVLAPERDHLRATECVDSEQDRRALARALHALEDSRQFFVADAALARLAGLGSENVKTGCDMTYVPACSRSVSERATKAFRACRSCFSS